MSLVESRVTWIVFLLIGAAFGGLLAITTAQDAGPESPCIAGAKWHDAQAAHWMNHDDQDFHLKAAQALREMEANGGDCNGWNLDATRPGPDGNNDAASSDSLQSSIQAERTT